MPDSTINTSYSESAKRILESPFGDEPGLFMFPIMGSKLPGAINLFSGPAFESFGEDVSMANIPWAYADAFGYKVYGMDTENFKPEVIKQDFQETVDAAEKAMAQQMGPGDEMAWDYINALAFNPAKRAIDGWTNAKLMTRLNQAGWFKMLGAYCNFEITEKGRKEMAWADAHYPLGRLVIALDRSTQRHVDYFDAKDKGELTAEDEELIRRTLLEDELRVSQYLNRIVNVTDVEEGNRIKKLSGIGNPAHQFNRNSPRGLWAVCSDNEARITGLKNGWPIEDLNALSDMKNRMDRLYRTAMYTSDSQLAPVLRDKPEYRRGEQEYITKMQELWAKIEKTPVRDNETRKALLTEIRDVIKEGVEKEFIPKMEVTFRPEDQEYSYELADIESKIARELTPAEREVMENGKTVEDEWIDSFTQNINDEMRKREEEYDAAERRDREKQEQAQAQEQLKALQQRELKEAEPDPRHYDEVRESIRAKRAAIAAQEAENNRFDPAEGAGNWFFDVTADERREAYEAVPYGQDKANAVQNDINRYFMGKNELNYDEALEMNVALEPDERRMLAEQYYEDLKAHPVNGVDEHTARANARYFGEIDARALQTFLREDMKDFNPADPAQVKELAEKKGRHGFMSAFAGDMAKQMDVMLDGANPESATRAGYAAAFGTRQELQDQHAALTLADKLGSLARLVQNENTPPLSRALALHSLQQIHAQMEGRSLADQDPMLSLKAEAAYNAAVSAPNHANINEGAPTQRDMEMFLRGEIESPFSEDYLKNKIEPIQNSFAANLVDRRNERAVGLVNTGVMDLGRIYNLDQISLTGPQLPIGPAIYSIMPEEQKEKAHRIFEQTLGNLIGQKTMQPTLSAAQNESLYDRFKIGGQKMSDRMKEIYGDIFDRMSAAEKERATELELMRAVTMAEPQVSFTPLVLDEQGRITERQSVRIPQALPHRVAADQKKAPTRDERFAQRVVDTRETAKKLNSIVPKTFGVFEPDYLPKLMARPDLAGDPAKARQQYLREFRDSSKILADMMNSGVGQDQEVAPEARNPHPEIAAYATLMSNRVAREIDPNAPAQNLPYQMLMDMVDAIHLPSSDAPDEKRPGAVFRALSDHPDKDNAFPVIEAAQSAERMMQLTADHQARLNDPGHPLTAEDEEKARGNLLSEIATLEGHLDEMERVASMRGRRQGLNQIFDDNAMERFMEKEPGIRTIRAELEGRRTLIEQGWTIEDTDFLSGFYMKRAMVKQALQTMPEGAARLAYERAEKALDEVCGYLDDTAIENADQRKEALQHIADYGPALFNDVVARTGQPDVGQLDGMKSEMAQVQAKNPPAAAFVNAERRQAIAEADRQLRAARDLRAAEKEQARREKVAERRKQKREDIAIGEALQRGLFDDDEPAAEQEEPAEEREDARETDPRVMEDIREAMRFDEDELGPGVPERTEKTRFEINDEIRAERERRQAEYEKWDPNDTGSASFDWLFSDEQYKAAHPFDVDDTYLDNLQEDEDYFGKLFDEAGRTYENHSSEDAVKWDGIRKGFFDWPDTKARLLDLQKNDCADLKIKYSRSVSINDDMRAWAMAEKGLTFEQAMELNTLDIRSRKKFADEYLDTLAAHPLNPKMSPEAREASARYYGEMHRKTYHRLAEMPFPEIDVSDREKLHRLSDGPSAIESMGCFATDMNQDTESLFLKGTPEVRAAYRDGLGGREAMDKAHNQIMVLQGVAALAQAADSPVTAVSPLRNKAMAKFYLEMINEQMKGKKLADAPDSMGRFTMSMFTRLNVVPLPEDGAPTDEEIKAYMAGKTGSPFSDEYMERVNAAFNEHSAWNSTAYSKKLPKMLAEGLKNGPAVYDLSYIPIGKDMPRIQNISAALSAEQLHETHVTFDNIFNESLDAGYSSQVLFSQMLGRDPLDNFRIDGKKVTEIVNVDNLKATRTPEEVEAILESEILQAYADPNKSLMYVPLALDNDGRAIEQEPLPVKVPQLFPVSEDGLEPVQRVGGEALEAAHYVQNLNYMTHSMSVMTGLRPGEQLFDGLVIKDIIDKETYCRITDPEEYEPGENEMVIASNDLFGPSFRIGEPKVYGLPRGTNADGTFTEEGRRHFDNIKKEMNLRYDTMMDDAGKWDSKDPLLAEMIRFSTDATTTNDRGYGLHELRKNGVYANMMQQLGVLHLGVPAPDHPYNSQQVMRAIQGYPTGNPYYPLPKAMIAARRTALVGAMQQRSGENDTLSRRQDRLNRRMYLAELDYAERRIEECDALYASTKGPNGEPDPDSPGFARVTEIDKYLDNSVYEASRYYPRGTAPTHSDSDARRMLISRGWPIRDLDVLARLNTRRYLMRGSLTNPTLSPEEVARRKRGIKVLDEIYGILERTEIKNAADRKRVLDQINGYGDLLFNDTVLTEGAFLAAKDAYKAEFEKTRNREPLAHEFLDEAELQEARDTYDRYLQARANVVKETDVIAITVNGPQSDAERAFLQAEHIGRLAVAQGQMEKDPAFAADPVLLDARNQIETYMAGIEDFYRRHELLDPANAEQRKAAFEELLSQSTTIEDALGQAEEKLTNGGSKTKYTADEEKTLKEIRDARKANSEMRRLYSAQLDYEMIRREDLAVYEANKRAEEAGKQQENDLENARRQALAEEQERYTVDLDYALAMLSEADQQRLIDLLTRPEDVQVVFDVNTGEEIPPEPRELPDRVRLAYDENGNLVPAAFIADDERRRELELERQAALRRPQEELRRSRRERRTAATQAEPDTEAAADLFGQFTGEENAFYVMRDQTERHYANIRRRSEEERTGDRRYEWSFAHVLDDALEQKNKAETDRAQARKNKNLTQAERFAFEEAVPDRNNVYSDMTKLIMGSYTPEELGRTLESLRPQWYRDVYLPAVEAKLNGLSPRMRSLPETRSEVQMAMLKNGMTPKEYHRLLGELANYLPVRQREDLRKRLLEIKPTGTLAYDEQVSHPMKGRIEELRKAEIVAEENEAPEVTEQRKRDYLEALEFAEKELDEVLPEVQQAVKDKTFTERDNAYRAARDEDMRSVIGEKDPEHRIMAQSILHDTKNLIENGVVPAYENALHETLDEPVAFADEHKADVAHMLRRMDEMNIPAMDKGEQSFKLYAYEGVARAKERFIDALRYGNPDRIVRARRAYEEKLRDMRELTDYAKEHFSRESSPGNLDSTRNTAVPWEFASDFHASSQVNGVYQLYSALKRTGVSVEEYIVDPTGATRRMYAQIDEERTLTNRLRGKSVGASLGTLMAETADDRDREMGNDGFVDMMINRSLNFMVESDTDPARRRENRTREKLFVEHHTELNRLRGLNRNPFLQADNARANEVMRLMSVVSEEDLAADTERMLSGTAFDNYGKKLTPITAEQYIAGLQNVDYYKLVDRSADVIRDAMKVEGTRFNAVEFLKERQKALSMLLTARPGDAGKQAYDLLEYELTHMAEYYDMLRETNPQMKLPALTQEDRQAFADNATQYEARRRQVQQGLTQEQRRAIARLRRNNGAVSVAERFRMRTLGRESERNRADEIARRREEQIRRRETMAAVRRLQRKQEVDRLNKEAVDRMETERIRAQVESHAGLDLTKRLELVFRQSKEARQIHGQEFRRKPSDPQRVYDTGHLADDLTHRADELLSAAIAAIGGHLDGRTSLSREELSELLSVELGGTKAAELMGKIRGGLVDSKSLDELTDAERAQVLGALAGYVPEREHEGLIKGDDNYRSMDKQALQGIIDDKALNAEERAERKAVFESQVRPAGPGHDEIERIRREIGTDWAGFSKGKGTQKDLKDFRALLDEADALLRQPNPRIKAYQSQEMTLRMEYLAAKEKQMAASEYAKDANRYIPGLTKEKNEANEYRPPAAEETQDIKKLHSEGMTFNAGYISNVAKMLRKMDQMQILKENAASEEGEKVYGFHRLRQAHQDLTDALKTSDPERIKNAVEQVKERRKEMDELYDLAAKSFNTTDYEGNLDLMRNENIPWEYARDLVTTSHINSMYILGSCLKESGISINEFEKDPGAAIQKMNALQWKNRATLTSFAEGKTLGTLTGDLATGYAVGALNRNAVEYNFKMSRGIKGLILADPGDPGADPEAERTRRNRNYMVADAILDFNNRISSYNQVVNNECLHKGMFNQSYRGREVLRTMMVADERDIDVERMFTEVPIAADQTRLESFSLSKYLVNKADFDYQAQKNRMESIMTDAVTEIKRLDDEYDRLSSTGSVDKSFDGFRSRNFKPVEILRARQEALFELLTLRSRDRNKPGFAELEKELREMPERYEKLRKEHPELGLKELNAAEKEVLKGRAAKYDSFVADREKNMENEEKRIAKEVETQEKAFSKSLRNKNKEVDRLRERMEKLVRRGASAEAIERAEEAYMRSYVERENLLAAHALAIADDYKAGKLPEAFATERLRQLAHNGRDAADPLQVPPLFGTPGSTPQSEQIRMYNRERFLVDKLLENEGFKVIEPKSDVTDAMREYLDHVPVSQVQAVQPQAAPVRQVQQPQPGPQNAQNAGGPQPEIQPQVQQPQPEPQVRRQPNRRNSVAPKVQDMGLADLINKVGGDNAQPEHRQRRNSVSGEQNRPGLENNIPDQGAQQGHGVNGPNNRH